MQGAFFAGQTDGYADQGGDSGAVDLRDVIENYDHFADAATDDGVQGLVQLFGGFADGEAAVDVNNGDVALVADVDFHGSVLGHVSLGDHLQYRSPSPASAVLKRDSELVAHYTLAEILDNMT
jgi:hypothetical protein